MESMSDDIINKINLSNLDLDTKRYLIDLHTKNTAPKKVQKIVIYLTELIPHDPENFTGCR